MGFTLREGELHAEAVPLAQVAADYGTPAYVYSKAAIETAWRGFADAFAAVNHLICYAVKANGNLAILSTLARLGSGFDIVSGGELERVLAAGGDPKKVVFSGVGKGAAEIERALEVGILTFNVESVAELERVNAIAQRYGTRAPVSLRVNPDVDARTHPYIATGLRDSKFGIDSRAAESAYRRAAELPGVAIHGIDFHIGSQITEMAPVEEALERALDLVERLDSAGIELSHIDVGGGLGIRYRDERPLQPTDYASRLLERLRGRGLRVLLEPGRSLVGNAGVLVTRVEYLKPGAAKHFAVVDAAMNDLLRPALYNAWQAIEPVRPRSGLSPRTYDVVGPVCESADVLGRDRPLAIEAGDLLAIHSAGAYGFAMSSNYNARSRPAELLVDNERIHVAREREALSDLWRGEHPLP